MFRIVPYVLVSLFALQIPVQNPPTAPPAPLTAEQISARTQAFVDARDKDRRDIVDPLWAKAGKGVMTSQKVVLKSRADGREVPAYVFTPASAPSARGRAAIVWVHPDIHGRVYEYFLPYVIEAARRGYVVIAPEYRGSLGYGRAYYDAIDYGGAEVDDVLTAAEYVKSMPGVDKERVGIIGWSHGGMITLLASLRSPKEFRAAAAIVPVTNLFQRLAFNGVDSYKRAIDPANRMGGLPHEKRDVFKERSPIYQIDKLEIPLLVHVARNDNDVYIEETMQLIDALRARKLNLAETKIYDAPLGMHMFDRLSPDTLVGYRLAGAPATLPDPLDEARYVPTNTPEQRDSWNRVWTFLEWNLRPFQ